MRRLLVLVVSAALLVGCVSRPEPAPAVLRDTAPPWDAPRDAVSYIRAAGLRELALGDDADPWILDLAITVDGAPVEIPAYIGIDRPRAIQAPVHTHDAGGEVWLEGGANRESTLGHFFALWGVRFGAGCLGAACGSLEVRVDGEVVDGEPAQVFLRDAREIQVVATS
ncbi:hypothetical protein H5392_06285 [Tessaracoccus sp. MC1865]|uniref:hypothetical protein n=1 Tax=Tessaracoccus sp. MC1865 TaxID=2760310 RepID=UPI001600F02E|nr:hypothetical protein [Tessaracoccus sp. MC1865]MBB1483468.1 hypothetical protein [Tessaracoccus sp. MC1865]QTO36567.1 hypothetical protein J7D54_08660 [Tessaracoccus sp. MC1865]